MMTLAVCGPVIRFFVPNSNVFRFPIPIPIELADTHHHTHFHDRGCDRDDD